MQVPLTIIYLVIFFELVAIAYVKYTLVKAGEGRITHLLDLVLAALLLGGIYTGLGIVWGLLMFTAWAAVYIALLRRAEAQMIKEEFSA